MWYLLPTLHTSHPELLGVLLSGSESQGHTGLIDRHLASLHNHFPKEGPLRDHYQG